MHGFPAPSAAPADGLPRLSLEYTLLLRPALRLARLGRHDHGAGPAREVAAILRPQSPHGTSRSQSAPARTILAFSTSSGAMPAIAANARSVRSFPAM